ncbi:hypothetical protein DVH05_022189 [Phytophthora capsici]|nr:hypothetical protein DVH05_022189 [Phytophthora capsici]
MESYERGVENSRMDESEGVVQSTNFETTLGFLVYAWNCFEIRRSCVRLNELESFDGIRQLRAGKVFLKFVHVERKGCQDQEVSAWDSFDKNVPSRRHVELIRKFAVSSDEAEWEQEGLSGGRKEERQTATYQQHKLNKKGYVVLRKYVAHETCEALKAVAATISPKQWHFLFGKGHNMGSKRLTAEAPLEPVLKLFKSIETGCRTFVPESDPRDWAFMKSLPGGEAQPAHCEFSPIPPDEDRYDYNRLPAWMIVAIDKGSYIYGYGWNRIAADEQERETIHLEKGDVVITSFTPEAATRPQIAGPAAFWILASATGKCGWITR